MRPALAILLLLAFGLAGCDETRPAPPAAQAKAPIPPPHWSELPRRRPPAIVAAPPDIDDDQTLDRLSKQLQELRDAFARRAHDSDSPQRQ